MLPLQTLVSNWICGWKRTESWIVIRKMWPWLAVGSVLNAGSLGDHRRKASPWPWGPFRGASHVGHGRPQPSAASASGDCCSAARLVLSPSEGSAWQPAHVFSQFSWVSKSLGFHRNVWNGGELFSPPANFSVLLFFIRASPWSPSPRLQKNPEQTI